MKIINCSIASILLCLVGGSDAEAQEQSETNPIPVVDATKALQDLVEINKVLVVRIAALEKAEKDRSALEEKKNDAEAEVQRLTAMLNSQAITSVQERERIQSELTQKAAELNEKKGLLAEKERVISTMSTEVNLRREEAARRDEELSRILNKRTWLRVFTGVGAVRFRIPSYKTEPQDSQSPSVFVIRNERGGPWDVDVVTCFGATLWDRGAKDNEQSLAAGPHLGFGGRSLFSSLYAGGFLKLKHVYIHGGVAVRRYSGLQDGFQEGSVITSLPAIPFRERWNIAPYAGVGIDLSVLGEVSGVLPGK